MRKIIAVVMSALLSLPMVGCASFVRGVLDEIFTTDHDRAAQTFQELVQALQSHDAIKRDARIRERPSGASVCIGCGMYIN